MSSRAHLRALRRSTSFSALRCFGVASMPRGSHELYLAADIVQAEHEPGAHPALPLAPICSASGVARGYPQARSSCRHGAPPAAFSSDMSRWARTLTVSPSASASTSSRTAVPGWSSSPRGCQGFREQHRLELPGGVREGGEGERLPVLPFRSRATAQCRRAYQSRAWSSPSRRTRSRSPRRELGPRRNRQADAR